MGKDMKMIKGLPDEHSFNLQYFLLEIRMDRLSFITFFYSVFLLIIELSFAVDIITSGQSISDGERLISASQKFEMGFFSLDNSNNRYLGIWYKISPRTVVWVANRNNPVADKNGTLTVSSEGNLALYYLDMNVVWSSNLSSVPDNPVVQLLDSGNLVLRESTDTSSSSYMWQSFDYPSDTLLPGMKLGWNLKTGFEHYLTSWTSADDPSTGDFSFRLDISGLPQLAILLGTRIETRSGPWNGVKFGGIPTMQNSVFIPRFVQNKDELYFTYETFDNTVVTRLLMNQSGKVQRLVWNAGNSEWSVLYSWPFDVCDNYAECGANGNCRISKTPICECLKGFVPKSQDEWESSQTRQCVRKLPSECPSGEGFLKLPRMKLPDIDWSNKSMNIKECEAECTKNCSCRAYANLELTGGGSGCLMWFKDLIDIRECSAQFDWGQDIFMRVPASELDSEVNEKKRQKTILVVAIISSMLILGLVIMILIWKKKKKRGQESRKVDSEVHLFELSTIMAATNNFSKENLLGAGGFGPVYKGYLPTGEEVAVKRLSENSVQGAEEFRNEAILIAKLQHKNLVALIGSCIQGEERLLIYEFMPNRSLDYFIYDPKKRELLTWQKRYDIVMGIARGLLYLHQDSKIQIIHRDLKASNILLDINLNPKISDFGSARIFQSDDKEATTNRIMGTFGYMSPEYVEGTFSVKSDVFSFGVLVLEIVSGQKNRGFSHPAHHHNLLGHAWLLWNQTKILDLMDSCLEDSIIKCQVLRCFQVGLLCVQKFPEDRPDMSSVVFMLANQGATLSEPKEPGFFSERSTTDTKPISTKKELHTENAVTITVMEGR